MKSNFLIIIALTFFLFLAGNFNVKAQETSLTQDDTTLSMWKYLTKTPWVVGFAPNLVVNNGHQNPFKFTLFNVPPTNYYPVSFTFEKGLHEGNKCKFTKGFSLQLALAGESEQPYKGGHHFEPFESADINIKYHLMSIFGDSASKHLRWFDPYALLGEGDTHFHTDAPIFYDKDYQANFNLGLGVNFWFSKNVGINLQCVGKWVEFKDDYTVHGTNYFQYAAGLVFKVGQTPEKKVAPPVVKKSNYKRSKEEEDALIHLREHINK